MKRTVSFLVISLSPMLATARDNFQWPKSNSDMEIFRICATIVVLMLVMVFVLALLKRLLDTRIKNKIIEKGVSETLAMSILKPRSAENGSVNFKWFTILAGLGLGFTIVYYTLPLGIHSLATMSFSLAASFLGYHYFLKRADK